MIIIKWETRCDVILNFDSDLKGTVGIINLEYCSEDIIIKKCFSLL